MLAALALQLLSRVMTGAMPAVPAEAALPALAGRVVVIDPGHGGPDPGGVGLRGTREKDVTLAVGLLLHDLLVEVGAKPVLTRGTDTNLMHLAKPGPERARRRELQARVEVARQHKADVFVSIHANKLGRNTPWRGAQTFWDARGAAGGEDLARAIQEELRRHTGSHRVHRPIQQYILEHSPVPSATVEVGFLSNATEETLLTQATHQKKLAYAIFAGIARYLAAQPGARAGAGMHPVPVSSPGT